MIGSKNQNVQGEMNKEYYYKKKSPCKQFDCTSFNNMANKVGFLVRKMAL